MEIILSFIDFLIHLDVHLNAIISQYGTLTYFILFAIVFCETGFVVTPFLPGDSLLFASGTFAATGAFDIATLCLILCAASFGGDNVNYWVGRFLGPKVFHKEKVRFLNKKHLERTHEFYERHGGKTIIIARFIPIVRTFAPFVAGIGHMTYPRFISYSIFGSILWVSLFTLGGYFFGNIPVVRSNFTIVIFAIIFISILPGIIEYVKHRIRRSKAKQVAGLDHMSI